MRKIDAIVIHHSASKAEALTFADIRRIHVEERGFSDVGYA